jgi:gp16 family phage-associated protein
MVRTPKEVLKEFERKGISKAAWATAHGFNTNLVHDVLAGRNKASRGQSHKIAVTLGLKDGEIVNDRELATAIGA